MKGFTRDHKFVPMTDYKKVTRKSRDSQTKLEGVRLRRDKKIPVYNTKVNWDNKRKPFKMWIVKHPEGSDVVKGSVTIVMAEHYGQAIDDYITIWNKENRMNRKIGYPVVQGTADKNFRYKKDSVRKAREDPEFELFDIIEDVTGNNDPKDVTVDFPILEKVMKENIQEILEREKIWKKGDSVSFPVGSLQNLRPETSHEEFELTGKGESGFYQYDFDLINAEDLITYHGTSFGDISAGSMIDMTVVVRRADL
jgi:hypothetical protein